jgi:glycosyltransferase involved in cell wall biosynthesis
MTKIRTPDEFQPSAEIHTLHEPPVAAQGQSFRIAVIGTYAPRRCGIATFTEDLVSNLREHHPAIGVDVYALDDGAAGLEYAGVAGIVRSGRSEDYAATARIINESGVDAVWLQHEYGIFGGPDGERVCEFVDRLAAPLILTLHTVLAEPSERQRAILRHLVTRASRIMVMSQHSRDLLCRTYGTASQIVEVIEHGAPDRPFGRQAQFKAELGLTGRTVLMTFGLIGPGKGLEHAISALPAIVKRHPDAIYRIVGATHPNLVAREGEAYRKRLVALAEELGVSDHVAWDNRFLETDELLDQLEACDIYLTPYPGLQQSTSGTLSYAVALGKAVISTPYLHARELLAHGVGEMIEPGSSASISAAVLRLLDEPEELAAMQLRAWTRGREMIWPRFADATAALARAAAAPAAHQAPITATPGLSAVLAMSDSTGMLQHSIGVVPDRRHGYCLDDNARALMLMNVADGISVAERTKWSLRYASFIQHAWNPDKGRFRNFMRFDRSWCEDEGSEDSNGRALWALGTTYECAPDPALAGWALSLYEQVAETLAELQSPRANAFAILGACAVLRKDAGHETARRAVEEGGDFLHRLLGGGRRPDWAWFETVLGYDNPRLSQAMIEAGHMLGRLDWIHEGLETLRWISEAQLSSTGHFRPVGSESFGRQLDYMPFDQQPLEAQAAIEAALSAARVSGEAEWLDHAMTAWRWFFGDNDRGAVLADLATGRCRDGVTPRGANANCGAESILAFQLAHYSLLALYRMTLPSSDGPQEGTALEPARERLV